MGSALLFATAPAPDPALLRRLLDQLGALGVPNLHVIARPGSAAVIEPFVREPERLHVCADRLEDLQTLAALAREPAGGAIALLEGDVVSGREALAAALGSPSSGTALLASGNRPEGDGWFAIRTPRTRVLAVATPYHWVSAAGGYFLGLLRVGAADRGALADAAERLAELLGGPLPEGWREELERKVAAGELDPAQAEEELPALLAAALVRGGTPVRMQDVRRLPWGRGAAAAAAVDAVDEDGARLESAVKAADGFFTTHFVSPYSKHIARWAARHGISPNEVTVFAMLLGVLAAAGFATGERWGLIAGALLLQAAFTFDCVDGQLARYTRNFSQFGAWLDSVFDRAKEYLVYAGLAIGSVRGFGVDVWALAGAALTLQTARHMIEFAYWDVHHATLESAPQPPLEQPGDRAGAPPDARARGGVAGSTLRLSRALDRPPGIHWIKKMIVFPIGERFAAISLTAALFTPRTTFIVLLAWGGVAAIYSLAAHVMHSIQRPPLTPGALREFRDDGPLARALLSRVHLRLPTRFAWLVPGLVRALEYGLLLVSALLAHGHATRACFALLAVLAFHHYDTVYRLRQRGQAPPAWVSLAGGGWDGRIVLAYLALLLAVTSAGMAVAAALLAVLFVGESVSSWLGRARAPQTPDDADQEERIE